MKTLSSLCLALAALCMTVFISCDEDKAIGRGLQFDKVTINPNNVTAGDSTTVFINYKDKGAYILKAPYTVTLNAIIAGAPVNVKLHDRSYNSKQIPEHIGLNIPDTMKTGVYTVTLKCGNISLYANAKDGTIYAPGSSVTTTLKINAKP